MQKNPNKPAGEGCGFLKMLPMTPCLASGTAEAHLSILRDVYPSSLDEQIHSAYKHCKRNFLCERVAGMMQSPSSPIFMAEA